MGLLRLTYDKASGKNVKDIVLSSSGLCVLQFGRPTIQENKSLIVDSPRWTIKFDIQWISNIWAKEYKLKEKESFIWMIELVIDCAHPPIGLESTKKRDPSACKPKDGKPVISSNEGPDLLASYPLVMLTKNYTDNHVLRIKLEFLRSVGEKGTVRWAWPVVVALMLGHLAYTTHLPKHQVDMLCKLCLDEYALQQHADAVFDRDGTGWQITR